MSGQGQVTSPCSRLLFLLSFIRGCTEYLGLIPLPILTPLKPLSPTSNLALTSISMRFLLLIAAFTATALAAGEDKKCWNDKTEWQNRNAKKNATFDVRVEHSGSLLNFGDWFDEGDVLTFEVVNGSAAMVKDFNITAQDMDTICDTIDIDWCETLKANLTSMVRHLTIGFDGESVYGAMKKLTVNVGNKTDLFTWGDCTQIEQNAAADMSVMEFLYVTWDITGMDDKVPDWMTSDEKLLVSSASTNAFTIATLLTFLAATRLF